MTCHRCGHEDARHASRLDCKAMCDECHAEEGRRYDAHQADPTINPCPTPKMRGQWIWTPGIMGSAWGTLAYVEEFVEFSQ